MIGLMSWKTKVLVQRKDLVNKPGRSLQKRERRNTEAALAKEERDLYSTC